MLHRLAADGVVLFHFGFILFVVAGWALALRWPYVIVLHLPAALWGALIEFGGWTCPLTPIENALREQAGEAGYHGGFVAHYVTRIIYPAGLTRSAEVILGVLVVCVNLIGYGIFVARRRAGPGARRDLRPSSG